MVYQSRLLFDSLVNQTMWWGVPVWIISHKATRIIPYNVTQQCHGGGGLHWKSRVQEYSSYTQRDSPTVKKFSLVDTFNIAYSDNAGHTNNWCRLTVILWIKKTQKHMINNFHRINQFSPYLTMVKVPPIHHTQSVLNQEVDLPRYIFLIHTYDVLVSGKMAGIIQVYLYNLF